MEIKDSTFEAIKQEFKMINTTLGILTVAIERIDPKSRLIDQIRGLSESLEGKFKGEFDGAAYLRTIADNAETVMKRVAK